MTVLEDISKTCVTVKPRTLTNTRTVAWHLFFLSLLVGVVVHRGLNVDTARRLQVTHWLWHHEVEVKTEDYPGFGIRTADGKIHAWYGIGQSLIMLPANLIATPLS